MATEKHRSYNPKQVCTQTEIYGSHIACCPLVSHFEYASRALIGLEKKAEHSVNVRNKDETDGRTPDRSVTLRLLLDTASIIKCTFL